MLGTLLHRTPPPPPLGETIPTSVPTSPVDNYVPIEEEVDWAVRRLWGHKLGEPSKMRKDHLWEWTRKHRATEATAEAETEEEVEKLGVKGGESATKEGI